MHEFGFVSKFNTYLATSAFNPIYLHGMLHCTGGWNHCDWWSLIQVQTCMLLSTSKQHFLHGTGSIYNNSHLNKMLIKVTIYFSNPCLEYFVFCWRKCWGSEILTEWCIRNTPSSYFAM